MPDANGNLVKRIDMALHFMQLAAVHNISVKFTLNPPSSGYLADRESRSIVTRPVQNTGYYVSALHEIGHIVGPDQDRSRLEAEWGAWRFAKENAVTWTDTAERVMKKALSSYCNRQNIQSMPDDFFDWVNVTREGMADAEPVT